MLLLAAAVWSAFLVLEGFDRVLDSEEGEVVEVVTDPTAPGFEAFVEQTWSLLAASEDDGGGLTGVAVLAVADRQNGGGTVLVLPPESRTGGGSLVDAYAAGGEAGLRAAVVGLLDVEVGGTALLTPARLTSLVEPAGPIDVASEIAIEVVDVVRAISGGDLRVVAWPSLDPAPDWVAGTVVETFPFPIPAAPGARITVRLLNGHGDFTLDELARQLLVAAGAEVSVVGNHEDFDVIGTRVLYRDPAREAEAARLAVVVGGGTLHDPLLSPAADLTVVLGADFAAEHDEVSTALPGDAGSG